MRRKIVLLMLSVVLCTIGAPSCALATTLYWVGANNTTFAVKTSWRYADGSAVTATPKADDTVVFTNTFDLTVRISSVSVSNIVVRGSHAVTFNGTSSLTLSKLGGIYVETPGVVFTHKGNIVWSAESTNIIDVVYADASVCVERNSQKNVTVLKRGLGLLRPYQSSGNATYTLQNNPLFSLSSGSIQLNGPYNSSAQPQLKFVGDDAPRSFVLASRGGKSSYTHTYKKPIVEADVTTSEHALTSDNFDNTIVFSGVPSFRFTGRLCNHLCLTWSPTLVETLTLAKGASDTDGRIEITKGALELTEGAAFTRTLTKMILSAGAALTIDADAAKTLPVASLSVQSSSTVTIAAGHVIRAASLSVGPSSQTGGIYHAGDFDWLKGDGELQVGGYSESSTTRSAVWTGNGADNLLTNAENWEDGVLPDLTAGDLKATFPANAHIEVPKDVNCYFVAMNIEGSDEDVFTISSSAGGTLRLGSEGITCASRLKILSPLMLYQNQTWKLACAAEVSDKGSVAALPGVTWSTVNSGETAAALTLASSNEALETVTHALPVVATTDNALGGVNTSVTFSGNDDAITPLTLGDVVLSGNLTFDSTSSLTPPFALSGSKATFAGKVTVNETGKSYLSAPANATVRFAGGFESLSGTAANREVRFSEAGGTYDFASAANVRKLVLDKAVTVVLGAESNVFTRGLFLADAGAKLRTDAANAFGAVTSSSELVGVGFAADAVWDLQSHPQSVQVLTSTATNPGRVVSDGEAVLTINATRTYTAVSGETPSYGSMTAQLIDYVAFGGRASLCKKGSLAHSCGGVSTSSGTISVEAGTLTFLSGASWGAARAVSVADGAKLQLNGVVFGSDVEMSVGSTGSLVIPSGTVQPCRVYRINGVAQADGDYTTGCISGGGTLRVKNAPATWETLGLWKFDGTAGAEISDGTTFSNLISGASLKLACVSLANGSYKGRKAVYQGDVPARHLFGDTALTNQIATLASCVRLMGGGDAAQGKLAGPTLRLTNFGTLLTSSDSWTIEILARIDETSPYEDYAQKGPVMGVSSSTSAASPTAWGTTEEGGVCYASGSTRQTARVSFANYAPDRISGKSFAGGSWRNLTLSYDAEARALIFRSDYGDGCCEKSFAATSVTAGHNLDSGSYAQIGGAWPGVSEYLLGRLDVAAVRVSRGVVPWYALMTPWVTAEPQILAHYRFAGTTPVGVTNVVNAVAPNQDFALMSARGASESTPNNSAVYSADVAAPYVGLSSGGESIPNVTSAEGAASDVAPTFRFQNLPMFYQGSFTLEMQVKTSALRPAFFRSLGTVEAGSLVLGQNRGRLQATLYGVNGGKVFEMGVAHVPDDAWHRIAFVYDEKSRTAKLYVDGLVVDTASVPVGTSFWHDAGWGTRGLFAGPMGALNTDYLGLLDEVRITRGALASEELLSDKTTAGGIVKYFKAGSDDDWNTLANWYTNEACTALAKMTPQMGDSVSLGGGNTVRATAGTPVTGVDIVIHDSDTDAGKFVVAGGVLTDCRITVGEDHEPGIYRATLEVTSGELWNADAADAYYRYLTVNRSGKVHQSGGFVGSYYLDLYGWYDHTGGILAVQGDGDEASLRLYNEKGATIGYCPSAQAQNASRIWYRHTGTNTYENLDLPFFKTTEYAGRTLVPSVYVPYDEDKTQKVALKNVTTTLPELHLADDTLATNQTGTLSLENVQAVWSGQDIILTNPGCTSRIAAQEGTLAALGALFLGTEEDAASGRARLALDFAGMSVSASTTDYAAYLKAVNPMLSFGYGVSLAFCDETTAYLGDVGLRPGGSLVVEDSWFETPIIKTMADTKTPRTKVYPTSVSFKNSTLCLNAANYVDTNLFARVRLGVSDYDPSQINGVVWPLQFTLADSALTNRQDRESWIDLGAVSSQGEITFTVSGASTIRKPSASSGAFHLSLGADYIAHLVFSGGLHDCHFQEITRDRAYLLEFVSDASDAHINPIYLEGSDETADLGGVLRVRLAGGILLTAADQTNFPVVVQNKRDLTGSFLSVPQDVGSTLWVTNRSARSVAVTMTPPLATLVPDLGVFMPPTPLVMGSLDLPLGAVEDVNALEITLTLRSGDGVTPLTDSEMNALLSELIAAGYSESYARDDLLTVRVPTALLEADGNQRFAWDFSRCCGVSADKILTVENRATVVSVFAALMRSSGFIQILE